MARRGRHFCWNEKKSTNQLTRGESNVRVQAGLGAAGKQGRAGGILDGGPAGRRREIFDNLKRDVGS